MSESGPPATSVSENGFNESFNGKLRDELVNGEIFYTLKEAEVLIEGWRRHDNQLRPHSAHRYKPPAPEDWSPGRTDPASAAWGLQPDRSFPPAGSSLTKNVVSFVGPAQLTLLFIKNSNLSL